MMKTISEEHGGLTDGEAMTMEAAATEAEAMLSTFASVGATHFDVTLKDQETGKVWFERGRAASELIGSLPSLLERAGQEMDIIVRPRGDHASCLIQLDDLTAEGVQMVRDVAFAIIETSRDNFQAWVAVAQAGETTAGRLRKQMAADLNASGAVRLCGTLNHKKEHAPHFPAVRLVEAHTGRTTTTAELEAAGLLSRPPPEPPRAPALPRYQSRTLPDYERCLRDAPARHSGTGPDISRADWQFALIAAARRFSAGEIAAELMKCSEKARREGPRYAERTARRAAEVVHKSSS